MTKETHSQPPMANHTTVSILELRAVLNGRVISPEDAAYDAVRPVFYGARSRRPALIVRVEDATDVSHVVSLARERDWSWPSAAAATASPVTAPPTEGSCSTSRR